MLFFCRHGQENLQELQSDSFVEEDVYQLRDELAKNQREAEEDEELASLSKEYINHSIRATSVSILGFEARHIVCEWSQK